MVEIFAAVLIILLFTHTGLGKVIHHAVFTIQMAKQPVPIWSKPVLVYALPILEIGTVLLLCFPSSRTIGFLLASILLLAYSSYAYMAFTEVYGYVVCACGKIFQNMNWRDHFYVNTGLALLSLSGLYVSIVRWKGFRFDRKRTLVLDRD